MKVVVRYWSWFRDLAGTERDLMDFQAGATLGEVLERVRAVHPRFEEVRRSTLVAVGVEYRPADHVLAAGDEVSLFPPVQGG